MEKINLDSLQFEKSEIVYKNGQRIVAASYKQKDDENGYVISITYMQKHFFDHNENPYDSDVRFVPAKIAIHQNQKGIYAAKGDQLEDKYATELLSKVETDIKQASIAQKSYPYTR